MAKQLKDDASMNLLQVIGGGITVLAFVPLVFRLPYLWWILSLILAVIGISLLAYGFMVSIRFDPNAGDPAPRKKLGQIHAIWGQQLAELDASNPEVVSNAGRDQPNDATSHAIQEGDRRHDKFQAS